MCTEQTIMVKVWWISEKFFWILLQVQFCCHLCSLFSFLLLSISHPPPSDYLFLLLFLLNTVCWWWWMMNLKLEPPSTRQNWWLCHWCSVSTSPVTPSTAVLQQTVSYYCSTDSSISNGNGNDSESDSSSNNNKDYFVM